MPDLPTITVTQAQYDRLALALPGDTPSEKASSYRTVVRRMLRQMVEARETEALMASTRASLDEQILAIQQHPDNIPE